MCKYTFNSKAGKGKRALNHSAGGASAGGAGASGGTSAAGADGKSAGSSGGVSTAGAGGKSAGGSGASGISSSDAVDPDCHFDTPTGITGDDTLTTSLKYVYIADAGNNAIQRIDMSSPDYNLDVVAHGAVLNTPFGITHLDGFLYVTSFNGHYIVKFAVSRYTTGGQPPVELQTSDIYAGSVVGNVCNK